MPEAQLVSTSLGTHVARSAFWSTIQNGGYQATSFVVFMLLARLLSPADIGLVAVSSSLIELLAPLMRGGLPEALIQNEEASELDADTCFWSNLAASAVLCVAILLGAPLFGKLFGIPLLTPVLRALSLMLPLGALSATHEARLTRSFGFKSLALRSLAANVFSGTASIGLALGGFGVWSLVCQRLLFSFMSVLFIWKAYPWVPKVRLSAQSLRKMARFGVHMIATSFIGVLGGRVMDLMIGYFIGPAAVGYVRVASRCLEMVAQFTMTPFASVALPALSRLQNDRPTFDRAFRRMVQVSGFFTFPAYIGLLVLANDLVPLAFGPSWALSGRLLQIMCLSVFPVTLQYLVWPGLSAVGRSDLSALGVFVLLVGSVAAIAIASPFGLVVTVAAYVARSYLTLPFSLALLRRCTGVRLWPLASCALLPCFGAILMAGSVFIVGLGLHGLLPIVRVAVMVAVGMVVYALFLRLLARDLIVHLRILLGR